MERALSKKHDSATRNDMKELIAIWSQEGRGGSRGAKGCSIETGSREQQGQACLRGAGAEKGHQQTAPLLLKAGVLREGESSEGAEKEKPLGEKTCT